MRIYHYQEAIASETAVSHMPLGVILIDPDRLEYTLENQKGFKGFKLVSKNFRKRYLWQYTLA